jgi:aminopeptidase N
MEILLALALALFVSNTSDLNTSAEPASSDDAITVYNAEDTKTSDVIHTDLMVSFDWSKQYLNGTAIIQAKPYFYSTNTLVLDAKGFDIHSVSMNNENVEYVYDDFFLTITLDREYTRAEDYVVTIDYTAKPNELNVKGSQAISDAKGLYFINPEGKEDMPQQIWTQGETEASSCWFPTIDSPNERMTQSIAITVQDKFTTLSNGLLVNSTKNEDGTRTDYWEQKLAHVPYLAMMAVGEFNITTDKWNDIDVDYYLEDDYHAYARSIFGRTPQMLEHFSDVLGVAYPWEKYAQIVVRGFVSGAMENTTAVIHGDFVQMTDRELLDDHEEDIIAHELFHHWFGDLVTCESWANLPLNESFATYGEYLWREKGFGRMSADMHLDGDLSSYIRESQRKKVDMIRFDYVDKEDMFDSHSYAKGGRILHMLRNYLGDDAFFNGLEKYLNDNAFNTVEIHQLRISMEEVCGEDLNWFFNQWFLASGHPVLVFDYDTLNGQQIVNIEQIQEEPVYRLPMQVDVYVNGVAERHSINMTKRKQQFSFDVNGQVSNVIVDAEQMLLAEIFDEKPDAWWLAQLDGPLYIDQKTAIKNMSDDMFSLGAEKAFSHEFWGVRMLALKRALDHPQDFSLKVNELAKGDDKNKVKALAIDYLSASVNKDSHLAFFEANTTSQSYAVAGSSLMALSKVDSLKALYYAEQLEEDAKKKLESSISDIYANYGGADKLAYFENKMSKASNYQLYYLSAQFVTFLKNQDIETSLQALLSLEQIAIDATSWMVWASKARLKDAKEHFVKVSKNSKNKAVQEEIKLAISRIDTLLKEEL